MVKTRTTVPLIEFLKNRIYLGAYDYTPSDTNELVYFTVQEALPYNAFHLDFGPLHIGNLYRFAVVLHNILNEESNQGKAIVLYSSTDPKERSNTACLLSCYMVLVQSWSPHQVLQPLAQINPPLQSFRDAGYSNADFEITIQDVVYGMWRAKERGMIDLTTFNLEEYEQYERVDQGDFNVISKDFIAFASPQQKKNSMAINEPFKKVLGYFRDNSVQLVVRLNSHLYDAQEFTKRNIQHVDLIFDDGTCPTLDYVKKFIGAAECVINNKGKIAVHCKAGLGRTGCLIGAHLIYTHGFTANECIGYMRMIRPGMVVGPQQHWLYLHQNDFRDWRHTMVLDNRADEMIGGLFSLTPYDDFKARMKSEAKQRRLNQHSSSMIDTSFQTPIRRRKISGALASKIQIAVPNESPGQPRKYPDNEHSSGVVELINNSDEEVEPANSENIKNYEIEEPDTESEITSASPKRYNSDWKVLRTISGNVVQPPVQLTKTTTTTTTTRTVSTTLSSPPNGRTASGQIGTITSSPSHHSIKLPKSRSVSRVNSVVSKSPIPSGGSGSSTGSPGSLHHHHHYHGQRVQSAGIRKVSGRK